MDRRVRADVQSAEVADLWTATYILMGLTDRREIGEALLRRVRAMEESVTYQEILSKGEAKGLLDGARRVLSTFGARCPGDPRPAIRTEIESIHDL